MKRLGPELKRPDLRSLKVPAGLGDLYQDLRDRRLLPLIALLLVAIVATPFLLGGGSDEALIPEAEVPLEASTSSVSGTSLPVVEAQPGLRDYRKRLRHRRAHDPFRPQYTGPVLAGTQLGGSSETTAISGESTTSESSGSTSVESTPAPAPASSGGSSGGASDGHETGGADSDGGGAGQPTFYAFAIDVKVTKTTTDSNGKKSKPEAIEKDRVLPPAALPGEKTQVVTYMGISPKTKKPLFLVSEEVESVFGETDCLAGSGRCQLLEVEPNMPVTFVFGESKARYKLIVQKIEAVPTGNS
jgi:hypothetical protein